MKQETQRVEEETFSHDTPAPAHTVWVPDPPDPFTANVWAGDEKRSAQNRLICKFRIDCVSGLEEEPMHLANVSPNCY